MKSSEEYLQNFKVCVIVVSHDRYFLDRVAEHLFVMNGDGEIRDFPGDYSTYRHCLEEERRRQSRDEKEVSPAPAPRRKEKPARLSFKEKKEKEALEQELPALEQEKLALEQAMSAGDMPPDKLVEAGERIGALIDLIDEKEMRLLELMEKGE